MSGLSLICVCLQQVWPGRHSPRPACDSPAVIHVEHEQTLRPHSRCSCVASQRASVNICSPHHTLTQNVSIHSEPALLKVSSVHMGTVFFLSLSSDIVHTGQAVRILLLPLDIITGQTLLSTTGKSHRDVQEKPETEGKYCIAPS